MKNILIASMVFFVVTLGLAQDEPKTSTTDADALAKQLQNPIASLISVPLQGNFLNNCI
jgi:hypothetical protein